MEAEGPGGVSGRTNTSDKEGGSDAPDGLRIQRVLSAGRQAGRQAGQSSGLVGRLGPWN